MRIERRFTKEGQSAYAEIPFRKAVSEIREDRSWETRLDSADLAELASIVGPTSREFGYDWP